MRGTYGDELCVFGVSAFLRKHTNESVFTVKGLADLVETVYES